ncbi:MAG TPA: bifunctional nuclease domain-containing protein [Acidimicrobiales bacterium]|nr:bifunctional nuclease domain-containing protein [Acidimicrobiales bacterium]
MTIAESSGTSGDAGGPGQLPDESGGQSGAQPESGEQSEAQPEPGEQSEAQPEPGLPSPEPERWKLVVVAGVSMELPAANPEVVLREPDSPYRELRIPVGLAEGTAIAYSWRHLETLRPLTHELVTGLLSSHQVTIEGVRVTSRRGKVFYAELDTMGPKGRRVVGCRPSDAIALALRQPMPTPILVADEVFVADPS